MGYVIKIPKRSDFCGMPPCPLCYDWAEDLKITNGVTFAARQLTGKKRVSTKDRSAVIKGAKLAHAHKRKIPKEKAPSPAELLAAYDERMEKQLQAAALKKIRLEKNKGMGISKRTVLIDNLELPTQVRATGARQWAENIGKAEMGRVIMKEMVMSDGSTQWIQE